MTTLAEYAPKATYRFCAFGEPKSGKTALFAQLARCGYKLHWVDLEDGIKTALKPEILPREFWGNINLFPINGNQKAPMSVETLLKVITGKECLICWQHGKVDCPDCKKNNALQNRICLNEFTQEDFLVIDSTTQLSIEANFATNPVLRGAEAAESFVLDKDTGGKDFKYPMAVSFILDRIFGTLQSKRLNVAVVSHEVMTESIKDTGKVVGKGESQPTLGGERLFPACGSRNFSRNFGKYFDVLIHCEKINGKHKAFSSSVHDSISQTGSRIANIEDMTGPDGKTPLPPLEAMVKLIATMRKNNSG